MPAMSEQPVRVAIIGAGNRGELFGDLIAGMPELGRVAAVAEPRDAYRDRFAARHDLPKSAVFRDWREFFDGPRRCDAVVVSTLDRDHVGPAVAASREGYHLLLEKPMAVTLEDCRAIAEAQKAAGTVSCVCHSLRYHAGFAALKSAVAAGRIGRPVTMDQLEQVVWWHQAHSFVRGNWGNEARSTFMLMAKSCHDIDYLAHLAAPAACRRVCSYGSLAYFNRANAPADSADRCLDCAREPRCPYSAVKAYVDADRESWPAAVIAADHSREAHLEAVRTGPYDRCVWRADNDVVDHQVVALEFEGGLTASFTMTAFTQHAGRKIRVHGTEGEIEFTEERMQVRTFADRRDQDVVFAAEEGGHGGGDARVAQSFLAAVQRGDPSLVSTDIQESLRTHTIVFAAERSRRLGRAVELSEMQG
jgi:predicted dehydrogenase